MILFASLVNLSRSDSHGIHCRYAISPQFARFLDTMKQKTIRSLSLDPVNIINLVFS